MSRRGHDRERRVRDFYERADWVVVRSAGSLGPVDLVAMRAGHRPVFVEVKSTAGSPFERFGPRERALMLRLAELAGADCVLAYWPPHGHLTLIPAAEWPEVKAA
jgi:Holliday junction resolvase